MQTRGAHESLLGNEAPSSDLTFKLPSRFRAKTETCHRREHLGNPPQRTEMRLMSPVFAVMTPEGTPCFGLGTHDPSD